MLDNRYQHTIRMLIGGMLLAALFAATPGWSKSHVVQATRLLACDHPGVAGKTSTETLQSGGVERTFRLHIPTGYDGRTPLPLVVSLHGYTSNPTQQAFYTGFEQIGDREGFIVVHPLATGNPTRWYAGTISYTGIAKVDDVQFFNDLLDALGKQLCIDDSRIFVNGLSNGGGMADRLACDLSLRIAAIGSVSGAYPSLQMPCEPARPIPLIAFHGTADTVVKYAGDTRLLFPAVEDWAAEWAKRNSCTMGPVEGFKKDDVIERVWSACAGNADVQFYRIEEGGHTWPGSELDLSSTALGKTTRTINASELMWEFFKAHPLPPRP